MARCRKCGAEISSDERAIYKRLVDRQAPDGDLLCRVCLADALGVTPEIIDGKIEHFRSIGCTLFSPRVAPVAKVRE